MSQSFAAIARRQQAVGNDEPKLLHEFFERQVALRRDHPAVECNGETLTYGQLEDLANQVASSLHAPGFRPGSLDAIYLDHTPRLYTTLISVITSVTASF